MLCDDVRAALLFGEVCEETDRGARIKTHCLYPSFDAVEVYVAKIGSGFVVTDGGGAVAFAYLNGCIDVGDAITKAAAQFGVEAKGGIVEARVPSAGWLKAAILGVANASAYAARLATDKVTEASENHFKSMIIDAVSRVLPVSTLSSTGHFVGLSGKARKFDVVARLGRKSVLVSGVSPHPASVAAKFLSFSDLPANDENIQKFAVYDKALEPHDAALINRVADKMVPIDSLEKSLGRLVGNG